MGAAIFTSGPYIEMAISPLTPMTPAVEDGVVTWRVPLGQGAVPHVALTTAAITFAGCSTIPAWPTG